MKNIKNVIAACVVSLSLAVAPVPSALQAPAWVATAQAKTVYTYFPKVSANQTSIVNALKSVGAESSYAYRKTLAALNGVANYSGTAKQNIQLLNLMKQGKLIRSKTEVADPAPAPAPNGYFAKCAASHTSIVNALKSVGAESSYSYRAQIAKANGINGYTGKASENTAMLNLLKQGKLKKPGPAPVVTPTPVKPTTEGKLVVNSSYNVSVSNKAKENKPHYENYKGSRGAKAYQSVIDQFKVATNSRYKKASGKTYCNIFAWDVMAAMHADFSHWLKNDKPVTSNTKGAYELTANATYDWLNHSGSSYGWRKVGAYDAQQRANAGYPTLAIWKNSSGGSGHVAVIRPEGNGYAYSSSKGCVIAQAGGSNYNYANISTGFGSSRMNAILYWTHD